VEALDPDLVTDTLAELAEDLDIAGVHIGMLASGRVAKSVAEFLGKEAHGRRKRLPNVVLDPILRSSSGADLLDGVGTKVLIERLIPICDVVTPNVDEATAITGIKVKDVEDMKAAAARLHDMGASAVVITGGHLEKAMDLLSFRTERGVEQEIFKADRQKSNSTHGTGCAFATAMACHLALNRGLAEATLLAKTYVSAAISNGQPLGRGTGPVNHLYRMSQQRRAAVTGSESS
jgi:hydroxymethylpyrimidine kinase/phosphomethylpyrimidine kinase